VAIVTPILAPLAGWFATFIADRVPGIPKSALNEIFIAGSVVAFAPAIQFVQGRLKWDLQQDQKATLAAAATGVAPAADEFAALGIAMPVPATELDDDPEALDAEDDFAFDDEDDEEASSDILDEVGGLLDDEEELDGLPEPQTTPAGG
jgi:hypothetical protein